MHKRLETDLISLAHSILQMKDKTDVFALKEKSKEIYEKLSLLAFIEEYLNTTPNATETKEALVSELEKAFVLQHTKEKEEVVVGEVEQVVSQTATVEEIKVEVTEAEETPEIEEILEQPFDELEEILLSERESEFIEEEGNEPEETKTLSLEEELEDTISVDEIATLFDVPASKSLNEKLANIQIDLNDRIAFVKNLFNGSQEDFNRVVSQLNTYATEKEAKKFINKMVKPDYDWSEQEALEKRFVEIVLRKFA
jgi:hypothetical protein